MNTQRFVPTAVVLRFPVFVANPISKIIWSTCAVWVRNSIVGFARKSLNTGSRWNSIWRTLTVSCNEICIVCSVYEPILFCFVVKNVCFDVKNVFRIVHVFSFVFDSWCVAKTKSPCISSFALHVQKCRRKILTYFIGYETHKWNAAYSE